MTEQLRTSEILTPNALSFAAETLKCQPSDLIIHPVTGGYSLNRRAIVEHAGNFLFAKEVDDALVEDNGERERAWLTKDFGLTRLLQEEGINIVSDEAYLSEDNNVLLTTAYRPEDGWLWHLPEDDHQKAYINGVVMAATALERATFSTEKINKLSLQPYFRDKLSAKDNFSSVLPNSEAKSQLTEKYDQLIALNEQPQLQAALQGAKNLLINDDTKSLGLLIEQAAELRNQPNDVFGHCDLRSDNLAYNITLNKVVVVDWNWASFTPTKFGSTEFLVSAASSGIDVSDWHNELNPQLLASLVGYWWKHSLNPPLSPTSTLREAQAVSAAVAYDLLRKIS